MLASGAEISPTLARMLACDAGIIPAVFNAHSQPVDVGRERLFCWHQHREIEGGEWKPSHRGRICSDVPSDSTRKEGLG